MRAKWTRAALGALLTAVLLTAAGAAYGQETISEVTVIYGSSGIMPPAGWVKVPGDLNRGAGGDFIYVCYKKGVGAPITGLYVTIGTGHPPVAEKCTIIPVDLNRLAGGDFIYLWTTKDPDCAVVNDITVIFGANAAAPAGYTKINIDLNRDAGGDFIYLCYRKE